MKAKKDMLNNLTGEVLTMHGHLITPYALFRHLFPRYDIWNFYRKTYRSNDYQMRIGHRIIHYNVVFNGPDTYTFRTTKHAFKFFYNLCTR